MKWTKNEIILLKKYYLTRTPVKFIAKKLDRGIGGVYLKAMNLNLKRPPLIGKFNPSKRKNVREKMSNNHADVSGEKNPMKKWIVRRKFKGRKNPSKRIEVRQKISKKNKGRKVSYITKRKQSNSAFERKKPNFIIRFFRKLKRSKARKKYLDKYPEKHPCRLLHKGNQHSYPHKKLEKILRKLKVEFVSEYPIKSPKPHGLYFIDCFCPKYNIGFECDGERWHRNKKRDFERDKNIYNSHKIKIIRISAKNILHNKNIVEDVIKNGINK